MAATVLVAAREKDKHERLWMSGDYHLKPFAGVSLDEEAPSGIRISSFEGRTQCDTGVKLNQSSRSPALL